MAGKVQEAKLDTRKSRARLERGDRRTHWRALPSSSSSRFHLGYERGPEDKEGRWVLRRYQAGKYSITPLGLADDVRDADGEGVLSFDQAQAEALARIDAPKAEQGRLTVRRALELYIKHKKDLGAETLDMERRARARILPALGDIPVAELTKDKLQSWLGQLARSPAMLRSPKDGKQNYKPEPSDDEAVRRRRSTANRTFTILRAALNAAWRDEKVTSNKTWKTVEVFQSTDAARIQHLSVAEAKRLINAAAPDFRPLLLGALQTGCRYSELCRVTVSDFNVDVGRLAIRKSKTGKPRHVVLSDEGIAFFREITAGRAGADLIFKRKDGGGWHGALQARPMMEACIRAKVAPVGFHALRHTYASLAVRNGTPMLIVAKNLGHKDTRMCEHHYAHFLPDYFSEEIRKGVATFGFKPGKVTALVPKGAR